MLNKIISYHVKIKENEQAYFDYTVANNSVYRTIEPYIKPFYPVEIKYKLLEIAKERGIYCLKEPLKN